MNNNSLNDVDPDDNYFDFSLSTSNQCKYISLDAYTGILGNHVSIFNFNIRSFRKNIDSFMGGFSDKNYPDILNLTETWFTDSYSEGICGYDCFHTIRSDRRSGGVSLYIKSSFESRLVKELSYVSDSIEVCTVEVSCFGFNFILVGIYRPHCDSIVNFVDHLSIFLSNSALSNRQCILMGDLNIDLLNDQPPNSLFVNLLYSHHFVPVITKPTHFSQITNVNPTLLDHIWINKLTSYTSGIILSDFTDHLPTYLKIPLERPTGVKKVKLSFCNVNEVNKVKFRNLLQQFDWNS